MKKTLIVGALGVGLLLSWSRIFPATPTALITDPNNLPGIATTTAPWNPEIANLRARLKDLGLPALAAEGSALHIHQHIDLNIDGNAVSVPAGIGINEAGGFISPIHTHDTSGLIHVESNVVRDFTLGQFFDIWGVRFAVDCIGDYCADATHTLKVYADGTLVPGDPRSLVLAAHQEIMVVYESVSSTPAITSSYTFASGY
jgi:hypothetical protein